MSQRVYVEMEQYFMRGDEQVCHVAAALSSWMFDVKARHKDTVRKNEPIY